MKPLIILCAVMLSAAVLGTAVAEDAPKDNKGFTTSKTVAVDLGSEIEGMTGRQLRMRVLTIEPGGHIGLHSHKDRPAVVYFLQGTDTVISADGASKTFHAGDTSSATKETTHWHRNDGKDNVVLIAVDIFNMPK
jgi:quercetin dioxygenase-like cupin family protein